MKYLILICETVTVKNFRKVIIDRHKSKENERKKIKKQGRVRLSERVVNDLLFTDAIPLLRVACCVSIVSRFAPL